MDLAKRYAKKDTKTLIQVLENEQDFSSEALAAAEAELGYRNIEPTAFDTLVLDVNRERIINLLNRLNPVNDELVVPKSRWLTDEEMRNLTKEEFQLLLKRKDGFRFNVWNYAVGGL